MKPLLPPRTTVAATLAVALTLGSSAALGQMGTQPVAQTGAHTEAQAAGEAAPRAARMARSARKATTYKMGTVLINASALTYALGPVGGGVVTAVTAVTSWSIYTANDYFWDKAYPPTPAAAGQGFDAKAEAWRTTLKYLTFKPLVLTDKCIWLYLWTGSSQTMLTWGMGIGASLTVWFYANNMAWDLYEWYGAGEAETPPKPPTLALAQ